MRAAANPFGDQHPDVDDDLRSLLSGNTSAGEVRNPHRQHQQQRQQGQHSQPSGQQDDLASLLSGNSGLGEVSNPHRQHQQQRQQQRQQSQHSQPSGQQGQESLLEEGDDSPMIRSNSNGSGNGSVHSNSNSGSKKALMMLGTVILAMGFLGPSGLLWEVLGLEEDGEFNDPRHLGGQHQGDRHHHLSPPPPPATGGNKFKQRHGKLATAKKKQRARERRKRQEAQNKQGGSGGLGIRQAIDNLDKMFLDNRPLPAASTTVKKERREPEFDDVFAADDDAIDQSVLPVVHYSDGDPDDPASQRLDANAEALDANMYANLPTSELLECRASVVAFVINATDVRDECDGLRRAFDKTCSVVHQGDSGGGVAAVAGAGAHDPRQHEGQRRRLSERGRPRLPSLVPEALWTKVGRAGRRLWDGDQPKTTNRTLREASPSDKHGQSTERKLDEVVPEEPPVQQQKHEQPMVSLNIPTADKHISEEMLADALLLQEADTQATQQQQPSEQQSHQDSEQAPGELAHAKDQPPQSQNVAPEPVANSNVTAVSPAADAAIQDAAESAGAIRTAVETVKNSMNKDPKSVEARTCCASILSVFHEHCDPTTTGVEDYSDRRLLVVVFVITVCGMVKSLIRHLGIRWLPEAGGCILVGVFGYLILQHLPHVQFAFDGDMFLRIMVPPIVFEAAVKINKQSFRRHVVPICIFAVVGTLASTAFTAFILYKGSTMLTYVTTIPMKESLIFGALISSIDPIAVLSVLNNMGMTDQDTIYVLIFGESLLNDGVAIVLFQTLVHFLDETLVIDSEVMSDAFMHFVVVALGSVAVGMLAGACATVYFSIMHGCQTPMVEVIMFCCWSFIPYYICDMVEWSGIVAIVANGFMMDLYVIGQKHGGGGTNVDDEIEFLVNGTGRARNNRQSLWRRIFSYEGHLSQKADSHVHFVIEIFATLMETAIFAYLGLFLFSPRYHWSLYLTMLSIFATVSGRVIMIPLLSHLANVLNRMTHSSRNSNGFLSNANSEGVHIDRRMQIVLVFAGLRGAMSFALVEHIPMYDTTTLEGSRLKPELKAMTSASVIFTLFVLGGATSYLMERLGYSLNKQSEEDSLEIAPLMQHRSSPPSRNISMFSKDTSSPRSNGSMRQRGPR